MLLSCTFPVLGGGGLSGDPWEASSLKAGALHPQDHPEPAAPLPPPEPSRVLQDLHRSHLLRGQGDACPTLLPPRRGAEPAPRWDTEGEMGWGGLGPW